MRLLHWCMLGVTAILLMCEVAVGHLCKSLITMVDGFHTLFILMHMVLPPLETAAISKPLLSPVESVPSSSQAPLSSSSDAGTPLESPIKSPIDGKIQTVSDERPTAPLDHVEDLLATLKLNQLSSSNMTPAASYCGLSFSRSRIPVVRNFLSTLLLTSLCISYLLEIIVFFLDPHPLQHPLLLVVVGAASLFHKTLIFVLNRSHLQHEQVEGSEPPADKTALQVRNKVEEEFVRQQEHEHAAQSSRENSLNGVVLCSPETFSIHYCDSQSKQQEPGVHRQETRVESIDTLVASEVCAGWKSLLQKHPVCRLSPVSVLQGLFTSFLALVYTLVMLLIAPQFSHTSENCNPLLYLNPALSLLAVVTLIASSLLQVYKNGLLLLQATPPHICIYDVGRRIKSVPGVQAMHDLHIWQLNESLAVASVHVQCHAGFPTCRCADVMSGVTEVLQSVGVRCCTVQPEFVSEASGSADDPPVIHREDPSPPPPLSCNLPESSGSMCCSPSNEEIQSLVAPSVGETKDKPKTLVIKNTLA